jgi:hypothetical protein
VGDDGTSFITLLWVLNECNYCKGFKPVTHT